MTAPTSVPTHRRYAARALTALVVATLLASAAGAPTALAADGSIRGSVVDGTTATPVPDQAVTVFYYDQSGKIGQANVRTDAGGQFTATPPAAAQGYQVSTTFHGAEFRTPGQQLLAGQPSVAKLRVFEPTATATDVTQTDWVVWLDRESGALAVQQDFGWANSSQKAYVGTDGAVVTVPLPPGATDLQFRDTFLEQRGKVTEDAYISNAPIVPGTSTATIRYTAPGAPPLQFPVTFPTKSFQLFAPTGITVSSPQLRLAGTTTDNGVTYQVLTASGALQPGTTIDATVQIEDVAAAPARSSTSLLLLIAGIAALAAFGFWLVGRRRSRAEARSTGPKKPIARQAKPRKRTAPAKVARVNGTTTDEDVDLLIDEIAALDVSFEQGLLDERTYRRLRVAAKDRLLAAQGGRELTLKE